MHKIRIIIGVALFILFVVANFYTVKAITRYGTELYLYDKLLVAYQFAGMNGLKQELSNVLSYDKMRHELIVAQDFEKKLGNIKNPDKFLADIVNDRKNKISFFRILRNIAFALIPAMLLLRIAVNRRLGPKANDF